MPKFITALILLSQCFTFAFVSTVTAASLTSETQSAESSAINKPVIKNAWIAEAPPGSTVMVAYMDISNPSSSEIKIISATSGIYSSIEFHETIHTDGMARMIRHENIAIPANSSVQLKRGGKHMMLFNPKKRLKANDKVSLIITTDDKQSFTLLIPVKKAQF